jgi:hypothetical protein
MRIYLFISLSISIIQTAWLYHNRFRFHKQPERRHYITSAVFGFTWPLELVIIGLMYAYVTLRFPATDRNGVIDNGKLARSFLNGN